ncbi:MAG: hypothetical protein IPM82_21950 [Saprospiraceae bacterium]|nr:hypothetical protein [Saprospiraceae bacterium]
MARKKVSKEADLAVAPMPFSEEDRKEISAIIANYKVTGEVPTTKSKAKRGAYGSLKGKMGIASDFDAPLEEMRPYME